MEEHDSAADGFDLPLISMSDFEKGRSLLPAFARLELHATRERAVHDKVCS